MCDCFHLAFPNWHADSSGTGAGRRLRAPEPGTEDDSTCDEPSQFTERERPRPQGSSPVEEYPETEKYTDSDKECEAEHDPHHKSGSGKKTKKSGLGSMFEKRSTPKMSKLKEVHSPESEVIVKTAKDGCAEGLVYGGGGKEGIFIKEVVPESPASKSLKLKEGDQILSATVYFDNVSYEDAIQILEHAQAYKVKLCLKRKPDITETDPVLESDVIPEEDVYAPEMREQGKTKRRGDARISWPKFPSFGKGRKTRFTRSHSSSEADEQRKLELSPTTSDTESPIKSQDALKGKKKYKMKLSVLPKRGRISSSEDQDTDAPTTAQMISPECLESPSGETPGAYVTEELKVEEDLRQTTEAQTELHKVELISIDSTLKTEDLTVALAGQESPSVNKSLDEKKKKKERSELKMRILGKDKAHKKAKSSPKRLKTLGASIEIADQPETDVIQSFESHTFDANAQISAKSQTTQMETSGPKVELEIPGVALIGKSPQKGKDGKTTFKLPKIGFTDIDTEETIPHMNVNVEGTAKTELLTTQGAAKEDPYERLSKSSLSRTKLPKREDIEIPGMEDMSMRTTAKGIKEPKAAFTGHYEDIHAETVQMSIDVDSVKEAVSKLPGFKLPKVDTSGVPIPEEITVIDANAQRISVKTPTKTKHDAHFSKFDVTASPEISKTAVKLPKITSADLTSEELLMVTHAQQSDKDIYKREHIIIPGKESAQDVALLQIQETQGTEGIESEYQSAATFKSKRAKITMPSFGITKPDMKIPDVGIHLAKGDNVKGERKIFLQEVEISKTETKIGGGVTSDVKIPEIDGIEYIDSVDGSPAKKDGGIKLSGFDVHLDAKSPKADISADVEAEEQTFKLPKIGAATANISVNVPDANKDITIDGAEIRTLEREGKGGKFKIPNLGISMPKVKGPSIDVSLSKKDVDVTLPDVETEVELPDVPEADVTLGNVDVSIPEPELEIKPWQAEGELDGQGRKLKKPKFGIKMPKLKGPEFDVSLSKKDVDVTLPGAKAEVKLPEAPEIDVNLGSIDVSIPEQKMEVQKPELEIKPLRAEGELDGHRGKFKMPEFGVKMPKIKGPEFDFSLSKKDVDVTLPEVKAEVKVPDVEYTGPGIKADIKSPQISVPQKDFGGSPSKFKMPTFKLPTFGIGTPTVAVEVRDKDKDVKIAGADINRPEVNIEAPTVDIEYPSIDVKATGSDHEGKGSKFKMPHLGFSMPKVKGPQFNLSSSKKHVDVTLPEASAEVTLPEAPKIDVSLGEAEVFIPEAKVEVEKPELEIKPLQSEVEIDGQGGKFKMPKLGMSMPKVKGPEFHFGLSKKDGDVSLPEAKAEVKVPQVDVSLGKADVSLPKGTIEVEKPELEIKPLQSEVEIDGQGSKFKMPKLGMSMPKVKGPEFHFGSPKKDVDVSLPEVKAGVKVPDAPEVDVSLGKVDVSLPKGTIEVEKPEIQMKPLKSEVEIDGQGSKFKMPKLGMSMPKVKGPEFHFGSPKKDVDVSLPEVKAEVEVPEAPKISVDMKLPASEGEIDGQGGKFKMPKLGMSMPKVKGPEFHFGVSKKDVDVSLPEVKAEVKVPDAPEVDVSLGKADVSLPKGTIEVKKPELEIKPLQSEVEIDGQGSKFKMPKLGMSMPKIKGPEFHFGSPKKDVDVSLPEVKAGVKVPDAPEVDVSLGEVDVSLAKGNIEFEKPEIQMKPLQSEVDIDGKGSKFKMPKLGMSMPKVKGPEFHFGSPKKDVDVSLPEVKAEVELPETPEISVDMKLPASEGEIDGKGGKFKMPKLGMSMPKIKGPEFHFGSPKKDVDVSLPEVKAGVKVPDAPEVDVSLGEVDVSLPKGTIEVEKPELEIKPLKSEVEIEGQGSKFKMPKLGMSMPKVKGPEFHFGSPKKDVDVSLPEIKAEVKGPEVELKEPSAKVEIKAPEIKVVAKGKEGSPSKFKMPTFKLPKFGVQVPNVSVEVPDVDKDVKIDGADINIPDEGAAVQIAAPSIDIEGPSINVKTTGAEQDGKGSKFKMPHLSFAMPKVKGPKMDVSTSKKDIDVKIPETKADVRLPEVDLGKVDVSVPEAKMKVTKPEMEMQFLQTEGELDGQGEKFKMPKFGIKMPKIKGPEFDLSSSKKDIDVTLPETNVEVQHPDGPEIDVSLGKAEISIPEAKVKVEKPELEIKPLQIEVEGQGSKFKMPKFGMSMPKVKGPEFHLGSSKKDVDITLPEAKAEVNLPDVELRQPSTKVDIKAPEIEVESKDIEGSPSKFKMPNFSFSLPKVKGPDVDLSLSKKDTDITLPGAKAEIKLPEAPKIDASLGKAEVLIPEAKVEVKKPEVEINPLQTDIELEGHKGKFQMPKFGITMPKVKGPDIDFSLSKKDVDVTLPEAKAEVDLPEAPKISVDVKPPEFEGEIDGQGGKFKMPKFGISMPKVKGPDIDFSLSKKDVDVTLPEAQAEVELPEAPTISVDMNLPECEGEIDGQGGKFKMPKFGISMPKVKGPEIDFSLSKKDVDITLPETKADINLPDVELQESSAKVEVKAPEIEAQLGGVKGSPSKFKMPTFKFPKFGAATPNVSAEIPDVDKEIEIDGGDMHVSVPHIDVDVPEVNAEVRLPEVEVKKPSGNIVIEQQPGIEVDAKLKKPRFSLPRFSFSKSVKAQEVDAGLQDVKVAIPEGKVEVKGGEVDVKLPEYEADVEGSKFKMPKFGITMPKVTGPEIDVDVTLPEAKAEIKLPDVEVKEPEVEIKSPEIKVATKGTEESPSKFKMPTFKIPKFGIGAPSATVEVPDMDKDLKIDGADIKIPEEVLAVEIAAPSVDIEGPSIDVKTTATEHEGKGSKFKLPSFGFSGPQIKGPDFDLSLSKKDVDVTLPEAKVDVNLPDVELKEPSAEVEIKGPKIKVETKGTEGSPSKFKMPTFKLPKFGIGAPSATVEVPDMDKDIKIDGADIKIPEEVLAVEIAAPSVDIEGPSIDIKTKGTEHEGSKFKLPSFGFSGPQIKGPDFDFGLSKKDVDVTLPEAKAEVRLPDVELNEPSAKVEIKAPGIDVQTSHVEGSPSKLKMPTFKLPKFGVATPQVSVEGPDVDKDIKVDRADLKLPEAKAEVKLPDVEIKEPVIEGDAKLKKTSWTMPRFSFSRTSGKAPEADVNLDVPKVDVTLPEVKTDVNLPDIDIKESADISIEGAPSTDLDAKMKKPRFSLPRFSFTKQSSKESKVDVSLPDVDVSLPEGNVEVKQPEVEFKPPEVEVELDGQESKFKMPKFGISMPKVKGPEIDVTLPEAKAEVQLPDVKIKQPSATVEIKAPEIEVQTGNVEGSPSKLKMPTFTLPKFGVATPKVSVEVPEVDGATVDVTGPSIDTEGLSVDVKAKESELEGSGGKFKIPKFGISMPKVKGPEIDLSLSKKDVDVTLPAEVKLPSVEVKEPEVEIKSPEIKIATKGTEGSPSKFKMPTFKLPKFGVGSGATVEVPDMDKDIKIDGADVKIPEEVLAVEIAAPSVDIEGPSIDIKTTATEHEGSKFKLPGLGLSGPQVKQPDIDFSLSKKDVDVTLPEADVKLPSVEVKETEGAISVSDSPTVEVETKVKRPSWTFPKFSFSRTGGKAPDVDVNLQTPKVDVTLPEVKAEVQGPSGAISVEEPAAAELDANLKKTKFSLPRFSFSKSSVKEHEVSAELPRVDVSLPEGEVIVTQPETKIKAPELEGEHDGQGSKFKLPKFGVGLPKAKGPEEDVVITLPEVKAEVKLPEIEVKESSASVEIKASETEAKGSPSKFKMPTLKMPKFGVATYDVTAEAPDAETNGVKPTKDVTVNIKGPSVDIKTDVSNAAITDADMPNTDTENGGLVSPSKFKLPSFTSFGDILKSIDVEFDVPKAEQNLETSKEVHETDEPSGKQLEEKETKQDTTKSPERTGWFRFPKFGLSSPSEPAKSAEKDEKKDEKSPAGETVDEEISPTFSVQSSDAFADISSAMTSEHVGLSSSSPTKVTVKYSDPDAAAGLGEMHTNIVTSTTRTELISVEPNLPEKITILSSGVSSSSEDTLRLESGKIHVITSNIQAAPEAEHAKLLSAVQIQSAGGRPLESEANEGASWTVEDSHGGKRTLFERHLVRETSVERSESKETIVITKQITRRFDSSEPISGETASSIQRLRDSVHSDKMRFFDDIDK